MLVWFRPPAWTRRRLYCVRHPLVLSRVSPPCSTLPRLRATLRDLWGHQAPAPRAEFHYLRTHYGIEARCVEWVPDATEGQWIEGTRTLRLPLAWDVDTPRPSAKHVRRVTHALGQGPAGPLWFRLDGTYAVPVPSRPAYLPWSRVLAVRVEPSAPPGTPPRFDMERRTVTIPRS